MEPKSNYRDWNVQIYAEELVHGFIVSVLLCHILQAYQIAVFVLHIADKPQRYSYRKPKKCQRLQNTLSYDIHSVSSAPQQVAVMDSVIYYT